MVGDGTWLNVSEAAERLGDSVGHQTIRNYAAADLLYVWTTAGGHRRIDPESVDDLGRALRLTGEAREAAFARIRWAVRKRRARDQDGTDAKSEPETDA